MQYYPGELGMRNLLLAALVWLGGNAAGPLHAAESEQGQVCRIAAGYKADGGVDLDELDAASAIITCEKAIATASDDLTSLAYYGRVLIKLGRHSEALIAARSSAEKGNRVGQRVLGYMYEMGYGTLKDPIDAVKLYRLSADQGYSLAQWDIGRCYHKGIGVGTNYIEAAHWYQKSADQGNAYAQLDLGFMYDSGIGIEQNLQQAVNLYRLAAAQGNSIAESNLGNSYEYGRGVEKDGAQAAKWFRSAAYHGYLSAQMRLAKLYAFGNGVPRNEAEALKLYRDAAGKGYVPAQMELAYNYRYGFLGLKESSSESVYWYKLAADQGNVEAQQTLWEVSSDPIDIFSPRVISARRCRFLEVWPGRQIRAGAAEISGDACEVGIAERCEVRHDDAPGYLPPRRRHAARLG
jgi:TPR repeat protein